MSISDQIEAVYQRALQLREQAITNPVDPSLLELALKDLYLVLEELQAVDAELHDQNRRLSHAQYEIDLERQRYRTLFELAPEGYLVTDEMGRIYHANRAAATLFAVPQEGLVGKPLMVLTEPLDWPAFQRRLAQPNTDKPWKITIKARQDHPVTLSVSTNVLKDSRHGTTTILWLLRATAQPPQELPAPAAEVEALVSARTADLVQANAQLRQDLSDCRQSRG